MGLAEKRGTFGSPKIIQNRQIIQKGLRARPLAAEGGNGRRVFPQVNIANRSYRQHSTLPVPLPRLPQLNYLPAESFPHSNPGHKLPVRAFRCVTASASARPTPTRRSGTPPLWAASSRKRSNPATIADCSPAAPPAAAVSTNSLATKAPRRCRPRRQPRPAGAGGGRARPAGAVSLGPRGTRRSGRARERPGSSVSSSSETAEVLQNIGGSTGDYGAFPL